MVLENGRLQLAFINAQGLIQIHALQIVVWKKASSFPYQVFQQIALLAQKH